MFPWDQPYRYLPLPEPRSIRLLRLGESWSFPSYCDGCPSDSHGWDLVTVSLDDATSFLAISYVWGDPRRKGKLRGPQGTLNLSESVSSIIHHLSSTYERPLHVWIDALCIDQASMEEKRTQLPLMRDIYKTAVQVIGWLGDVSVFDFYPGTRTNASHSLKDAADAITSYAKRGDANEIFQRLRAGQREIVCQCRRDRGRELLHTFDSLFSRKWFHRTWVFQEIVCGSLVVITFQNRARDMVQEILWDDLFLYLHNHNLLQFDENIDNMEHIYGSSNVCITAGRRYLRQQTRTQTSLQTLLTEVSSTLEATDPRDRIYGLVGLSSDIRFEDLKPAYSESVQSVYIETASLLLTSRRDPNPFPFALLSFAGIGRARNFEGLPSWVPDWTSATHRLYFVRNPVCIEESHFEKISGRAGFDATQGATYDVPYVSQNRLVQQFSQSQDSSSTV